MDSPDLLPNLAQRAELVRRYAYLVHHFGKELGDRPLVRQNGEFFPDRFAKDQPSVERLVRRLQGHAGLLDVPIEVRLLPLELADGATNAAQGCGSGGCGSGSCATPGAEGSESAVTRIQETSSGWTLNVFDAELHHPVALTTQLSLALAEIFLAETSSSAARVEAPLGASRDLACVALGLGLLALQGSYIYSKSCGGPSVARLTELSVGELSVACSLFIARGKHSARRALAELGATQRELLDEANAWAASNATLIQALREHPGQLATRAPAVLEARSWLLRVFERGPKSSQGGSEATSLQAASLEQALAAGASEDELLELAQASTATPTPRQPRAAAGKGAAHDAPAGKSRSREREELAALVDEALRSS
jgi:hypothetical protein